MNNGIVWYSANVPTVWCILVICCWCIVRVRVRVPKKKREEGAVYIYVYFREDMTSEIKDTENQ